MMPWTHETLLQNPHGVIGADAVISYLNRLSEQQANLAKEYIVRAPAQVQTRFRRRIEDQLRQRSALA